MKENAVRATYLALSTNKLATALVAALCVEAKAPIAVRDSTVLYERPGANAYCSELQCAQQAWKDQTAQRVYGIISGHVDCDPWKLG